VTDLWIQSLTRKSISTEIVPKPTGKTCFRWLVPVSRFHENADTAEVVKDPGSYLDWKGPRSRVVGYPCAKNTMFNMAAFLPSSKVGDVGMGELKTADPRKR
jgi:salicylate hydroxylase